MKRSNSETAPRVALLMHAFAGGGAQRVMVRLANQFVELGIETVMVVGSATGPLASEVSPSVRVVDLGATTPLKGLLRFARFLRREHPDAVLSTLNDANVAALVAAKISRYQGPVVVRVAADLAQAIELTPPWWERLTIRAFRLLAGAAHKVVAVSDGVASSLVDHMHLDPELVTAIHNPVDRGAIEAELSNPHPLPFTGPFFLSVGRLDHEKDMATLIEAYGHIASDTQASLLILGEGPERTRLENLAARLGIGERVHMPGFDPNPFPSMAACEAFVLSSRVEGYPNVILEALTCGAKVVATNARSGTAEALGSGALGTLVEVGDSRSLGLAMLDAPDLTRDEAAITDHLDRLAPEAVARRYLDVLSIDEQPRRDSVD